MRILHIIHSADPKGGGPIEAIRILTQHHLEQGRSVEVLSLDGPQFESSLGAHVPIHCMGPGRGNYGYSPRFTQWLDKNHQRFDALIINGVWQFSSFGAYRVFAAHKRPYFQFPHGMLDPWFRRAYPLKHVKKLVYWLLAERRVLNGARAVLFTAEEERLQARRSFPFYHCREHVVGYAAGEPPANVAELAAEFSNRFADASREPFLLFLGRVHPKKGIDLLLRAYAQVSSSGSTLEPLVIAGPPVSAEYQGSLEQLALELGISKRITWTGMLDHRLKWGALARASAFVLPSHQENFGVAVAEALACGVPVLISNKVNIWREIVEDRAGWAGPDTVEGAIELLRRWRDDRGDLLRQNARNCYLSRYHPRKAAAGLAQTLQSYLT